MLSRTFVCCEWPRKDLQTTSSHLRRCSLGDEASVVLTLARLRSYSFSDPRNLLCKRKFVCVAVSVISFATQERTSRWKAFD